MKQINVKQCRILRLRAKDILFGVQALILREVHSDSRFREEPQYAIVGPILIPTRLNRSEKNKKKPTLQYVLA